MRRRGGGGRGKEEEGRRATIRNVVFARVVDQPPERGHYKA